MEKKEIYLTQYDKKVQFLKNNDELWRLRVTRQEFIQKLEELRIYEVEASSRKYLNDYHIKRNIEGSISIMLMDAPTFGEAISQSKYLREEIEKNYAIEAPEIKELASKLKLPLDIPKLKFIFYSIFRNQISPEDLPENVKTEFLKTDQYQLLMQRSIKKT